MIENHISGVDMNKRRTPTNEFKARVALEDVRGDKMINEIVSDYKIHPIMIAKWKNQFMERIAGCV